MILNVSEKQASSWTIIMMDQAYDGNLNSKIREAAEITPRHGRAVVEAEMSYRVRGGTNDARGRP